MNDDTDNNGGYFVINFLLYELFFNAATHRHCMNAFVMGNVCIKTVNFQINFYICY